MSRPFKIGSLVMGLVGAIASLVVSLCTYTSVAADGNVLIAVIILVGGILGGIVGIIGTAYIKLEKIFTPIMQLASFGLVLIGAVAMVVYSAIPDSSGVVSTGVLVELPFLFIPDLLIGVAGIMSLIGMKETKEASESEEENKAE